MAQTKTRSKPKPKARASSTKPKKANSTKQNSASKPKEAVEAVESTAKDAGRAVGNAAGKAGHAVSKAKLPLLAGGAAVAGVAGGMALGAHQARRHRGLKGVDSDDLAKAARKVGRFGAQMGEVALEMRRRQESNGKSHRSPIEVVLDGLTARPRR